MLLKNKFLDERKLEIYEEDFINKNINLYNNN